MSRPLCPAGAALSEWLETHSKTQQWLADELGVGRAVLWRWLVGETKPHINGAAALERVTGIQASLWATNMPATGTEG